MVSTENLKTGTISVLLISLIVSMGYSVAAEDTHFCEDREISHNCNLGLSKYYSLDNGKCLSTNGNKLCRSGWVEIDREEPDIIPDVDPLEQDTDKDMIEEVFANGCAYRCPENPTCYSPCFCTDDMYGVSIMAYYGELREC